jgi:hypothetical protein
MNIDADPKLRAGILYVATKQERYIEEAFISADSVKQRYPDLHVTLFTDQVDHQLCGAGRFDIVLAAPSTKGIESEWSDGQLRRLLCLRNTPYQYTLHLDTDTQVVTNELMSLFDMLDGIDVAMVETAIDDSACRVLYGRPMFNAGLVLYRRNQLTWDWLAEWASLSERNFRWASKRPLPRFSMLRHITDEETRRTLLGMDQISLVEILSPEVNKFGLKLKTLDSSWNYRGSRLAEKNQEAPRILHLPRQKSVTHASELEAAIQRALVRK